MLQVRRKPRPDDFAPNILKPNVAKGETINRGLVDNMALAALVSQRLSFFAIALKKGTVVNDITFLSGGTALATGVNQWFSLYNKSLGFLRATADGGAGAWAANTFKTLTLSSPYTIPTDDLYYLGILVNATTVPTLAGILGSAPLLGLAPILAGTSNTAITTPATAPATAAALTAYANRAYAYVG